MARVLCASAVLAAVFSTVNCDVGCSPGVVMIRHGEDLGDSPALLEAPKYLVSAVGAGPLSSHHLCDTASSAYYLALSKTGVQRAMLLQQQLDAWVAELGLCPVDRITTVDPAVPQSTTNPFWTLLPYGNQLCRATSPQIDLTKNLGEIDTHAGPAGTRIIVHTSQAFWGDDKSATSSPDPSRLLRKFYAGGSGDICFPNHSVLYVLTGRDAATGKWTSLKNYNMPALGCVGGACVLAKTVRAPGVVYCGGAYRLLQDESSLHDAVSSRLRGSA
jgi:hypothetical protein